MDLKKELNKEQYIAATHVDGPLLILAGAGSGKTRVITYRIANLVQNVGINPYNILAITFTNKAAKEMEERVADLLGGDLYGIWVNTFHAACGKILRKNSNLIGFSSSFIIYDEAEVMTVIKDCLNRLNIDEKYLPPKMCRNAISKAKDEMLGPKYFTKDKEIGQVYDLYQKILFENNAMDFDDMILHTIKILKENPDVLAYYQDRFQYILVDEYQDTNMAQYEFIRLLADKHKNLCVVGDDDQSIYGFRGADIRNILEFENEYKDCKVIKLEENYRSSQNILDAANKVISKNNSRKDKKLWTSKGKGKEIEVMELYDHNQEAQFVINTINKGIRQGKSYSDFAILYRINALSQSIESALSRFALPYKIYGGLRFFDRKEIKDLIAYLRLIDNSQDELALRRVVNVPKRGIGIASYQKAEELAASENTSILSILLNSSNYPQLSRASKPMTDFALTIYQLIDKKDELPISEFVKLVLDKIDLISEYKKDDTYESQARVENLMEFISVAKDFEEEREEAAEEEDINNLTGFLQNVALSTEMDKDKGNDDAVTLMTIHSAKGLEFPNVFVIALEDGIFPSYQADEAGNIEEERRLMYVSITRAMDQIYLSHCKSRMLYGRTMWPIPSRFLTDDLEYSSESGQRIEIPKKEKSKVVFIRQVDSVKDVMEDGHEFLVGDRVNHKKFGDGTILNIDGIDDLAKVEIDFDEFGVKRFMLQFAKLKPI